MFLKGESYDIKVEKVREKRLKKKSKCEWDLKENESSGKVNK